MPGRNARYRAHDGNLYRTGSDAIVGAFPARGRVPDGVAAQRRPVQTSDRNPRSEARNRLWSLQSTLTTAFKAERSSPARRAGDPLVANAIAPSVAGRAWKRSSARCALSARCGRGGASLDMPRPGRMQASTNAASRLLKLVPNGRLGQHVAYCRYHPRKRRSNRQRPRLDPSDHDPASLD
jgi:hypothetical protein